MKIKIRYLITFSAPYFNYVWEFAIFVFQKLTCILAGICLILLLNI